MKRLTVAGLAAIALVIGLGNVAAADHLKPILDMHVVPAAKADQGYVITVHAATADVKALVANEDTVHFYEVVDLFGPRDMYLGTEVTDGQGNASFVYLPARLGKHEIIARSGIKDHFVAAEGRTTFEATVAAAPYQPETVALSGFTKVVTGAVGVIILAVWALIAFAFISTARGVRLGARDQVKGDHA